MLNKALHTNFQYIKSPRGLNYNHQLLLVGSCFSENIFQKLSQRKFNVQSNPFGILFDVLSIEKCIEEIVYRKKYTEQDLFFHNELFGSWAHHTDFSDINEHSVLSKINETIAFYHDWLKKTDNIILTLGSAFSYFHIQESRYVANCHKVPQIEFRKELLGIETILQSLERIRKEILSINPKCHITLTISPVRHLRDGVIENNRSKARLIEAVYQFCQRYPESYYFPSYEIVIDVLRDYRFFDTDFAHPNYLATDIVFDYFKDLCISPSCYEKMDAFYQLYLAKNHKSKHPETKAHQLFLTTYLEKTKEYQLENPLLDFSRELEYFQKK